MPLECGKVVKCDLETGKPFKQSFYEAKGERFNFVVASITHPICCCTSNMNGHQTVLPCIENEDFVLSAGQWAHNVIGGVSSWINLDSTDEQRRRLSVEALKNEFKYFDYIGVNHVLLSVDPNRPFVNLANFLREKIFGKSFGSFQILISLPMSARSDGSRSGQNMVDTWSAWQEIRTICRNIARLGLVLELGQTLSENKNILKRWFGESIFAISVDGSLFHSNSTLCLPETHEIFLKSLFGTTRCKAIVDLSRMKSNQPKSIDCLAYLETLWGRKLPSLARRRAYNTGANVDDQLGDPMLPCTNPLPCEQYRLFETDIPKYQQYTRAVLALLQNRRFDEKEMPKIVMVLGAGRGPLVSAVFKAYDEMFAIFGAEPPDFKVYAIEKNYGAIPILNWKNKTYWDNKVIIVNQDMRDFKVEEKADLVVSEMLGSFGDNELSPECLDGALHLMKETCVSIPAYYQSYLAPVQSSRLISELKKSAFGEKERFAVYDKIYISWLCNSFEIDEAKLVYEFSHPNFVKRSNERDVDVEFEAREKSEIAGFIGYFYAHLYDKAYISTVPETHTLCMDSWSSLIFALREPVMVEKYQKIVFNLRRKCNETKVWYEWKLKLPVETCLQNENGRFYSVPLKTQNF